MFLDEGNKALKRLLQAQRAGPAFSLGDDRFYREKPKGIQYRKDTLAKFAAYDTLEGMKARGLLAKRPVSVPRRRPPRVVSVLERVAPNVKKVRDAVICAGRQIRRELVFATGSAGQNRKVPSRVRPSSVRC